MPMCVWPVWSDREVARIGDPARFLDQTVAGSWCVFVSRFNGLIGLGLFVRARATVARPAWD
eukprot:2340399-Lingulodinium_polyedra.AAC.1